MHSYAWLMAPHEYKPDYEAYLADLDSLEQACANIATYDDWFPSLETDSPIAAEQQGGVVAAIRKVRDGYASQARFADIDAAVHFREFVRRIDIALS